MEEIFGQNNGSSSSTGQENEEWDSSQYEALLKGGEQVVSVLQEMVKIVSFPLIWFGLSTSLSFYT